MQLRLPTARPFALPISDLGFPPLTPSPIHHEKKKPTSLPLRNVVQGNLTTFYSQTNLLFISQVLLSDLARLLGPLLNWTPQDL